MKQSKKNRRYNLSDSPFYKLNSKKKLAKLLYTSTIAIQETLRELAPYKRCWKHKRDDAKWLNKEPSPEIINDYRPIDIPTPRRKCYQRRISSLLSRIEPPDYLFNPVKGRSYVNNATHHLGSDAFWMLDIANFFPSCSSNNVAWFFGKILKCSPDITAILVRISTHNECLPQGSPSSPILAYFSNSNMWKDIRKLTEKYDCRLSIYADDITISGKVVLKELVWKITKIIHKQGLSLKREKEQSLIFKPVEITGVIVSNGKPFLPNRQHKELSLLKLKTLVNERS